MLTGCQRVITLQSHSDVNLSVLGEKIKVNTTGVIFDVNSPGVIASRTGTGLSITGNLSRTTDMILRNYGSSYTKFYMDPTALLWPLVNPQSYWQIILVVLLSRTQSFLLHPLPAFLIKECIDICLPSIKKLVNCSLCEGLVPDGFKNVVVTPLIKKASLPVEDLKNYRPASGLSFISKLVERILAKQLVDQIHRHDLDNSYQSGYKSGHSMEMALLAIQINIHLSLSRGEATALVLDLSAAFDTIDHSTLLSSLLHWFGVGSSTLKLFSSYLTEYFQSVKIGSTLLDLQKLLFGVT